MKIFETVDKDYNYYENKLNPNKEEKTIDKEEENKLLNSKEILVQNNELKEVKKDFLFEYKFS